MPTDLPKVPVDVAATGPKVIAAAARHADRVTFAVGADAERIRWGMEVARAARAEAGLSAEIPFGAYVTLIVHDDPERSDEDGRGVTFIVRPLLRDVRNCYWPQPPKASAKCFTGSTTRTT